MAVVRYTVGKDLTPERREAMKAEIQAAAGRPYTYDPDCPLLTVEQLAEFRPVNFDSMEERARHMEAMDKAVHDAAPVHGMAVSV